ncbi:MAG: hypothetical protein V7K32_05945 [Nostoc sp.]
MRIDNKIEAVIERSPERIAVEPLVMVQQFLLICWKFLIVKVIIAILKETAKNCGYCIKISSDIKKA